MEGMKKIHVGDYLSIAFCGPENKEIILLYDNAVIKKTNADDKIGKKIFILDAVDIGAKKTYLAKALGITYQTINNYINIRDQFGIEGLLLSYTPSRSKNLRVHREEKAHRRMQGNTSQKAQEARKAKLQNQLSLPQEEPVLEDKDQPYCKEHEWFFTRYAGVFVYIITLISHYDWFNTVQTYLGSKFKVLQVFVLMTALNIRSIEQLKNVRLKEAARILGLAESPSRKNTRTWLYQAVQSSIARELLDVFYQRQIEVGIVGLWLWFTDGHLLPYTGKEKLRPAYNTQRRLMVPGRTSLVTTDQTGRVIDFEIQEGKGDLKGHITALDHKWRHLLPQKVVHVFDREGDGAAFFYRQIQEDIFFVTWEKNADTQKLASMKDDEFSDEFKLNEKIYRVCEGRKTFSLNLDGETVHFSLRKIAIWNVTSNRRTSGLSNVDPGMMSTRDCALAILNRWGASENTFKHIQDRHAFHYQPGFSLVQSERQDIANPVLKEKKSLIKALKSGLSKLYKRLSKTKEAKNKDGTPRKNNARLRLQSEISEKELELKKIQEDTKDLPERIDVTELEDYSTFKQLSNESKYLFDCVTSLVWNARKQMVEWLRDIYGNKNEYIDLFYAITRCHGWIQSESDKVTVRLEPLEQPSRRSAQEQLCRKLTSLKATTPTGKLLRIEIGKSPLR